MRIDVFLTLCVATVQTLPAPADWTSQAQQTLRMKLNRKDSNNVAKNVILFVGDGMGISTVTAGRIYKGQKKGGSGEEEQLTFEKFPHVGLSKTYTTTHQVADSSGTATAMLSGVKTGSGVVGVNQKVRRGDCQGQRGNELSNILDWSSSAGKSTGIVTTTRVTHATPASAYAHSADRNWESDADVTKQGDASLCEDIASQLVTSAAHVQVILGGGRRNFLPTEEADPEYGSTLTGSRKDGRNLIQEWVRMRELTGDRSTVAFNQSSFDAIDPETTDYILGLFEPSHMRFELDRANDVGGEPSLAEMTEKAIRVLRRNDQGFFLLVEGGRIDHGHHDNMPKRALEEVVALDAAVERAIELTSEDETLVVVTADHSHVFTIGGYPERGNPILGHRGDEDDMYHSSLDGLPVFTLGYVNGPGSPAIRNASGQNTEADDFVFPAGFPIEQETHGGEDVAVFARGPMAFLFDGVNEQNFIAHAMAEASCIGSHTGRCMGVSQHYRTVASNDASMFRISVFLSRTIDTIFVLFFISRIEL